MMDGDDNIGIDIGCGARFHEGELKGTHGLNTRHPSAGRNTGVVRALREHMLALKSGLESRLEESGLTVVIASRFAAWSRWNGVQYHAQTEDVSFQLEVNRTLREDILETAKMITDSLHDIYGEGSGP